MTPSRYTWQFPAAWEVYLWGLDEWGIRVLQNWPRAPRELWPSAFLCQTHAPYLSCVAQLPMPTPQQMRNVARLLLRLQDQAVLGASGISLPMHMQLAMTLMYAHASPWHLSCRVALSPRAGMTQTSDGWAAHIELPDFTTQDLSDRAAYSFFLRMMACGGSARL